MNQPLSSYTIFCGVILLDKPLDPGHIELPSWLSRLEHSAAFLQYVNKSYYQSFLSNIAPEAENLAKARHFTLASFNKKSTTADITLSGGEQLHLTIPYFDFFLFPDGVGIFTFKTQLNPQEATYANISSLVNHVRQPGSILQIEGGAISVANFISQSLSPVALLRTDWDQYIPQLKSYTIVDDPKAKGFSDELDRTLYELSHVLPIGSSKDSEFTPTPEYMKGIMTNSIAVYNNWKAIVLFDTFTRISCSYPDTFKTWEQEYFLIYIHSLYSKYQLYSFNSRLRDVATISRQTKEIRNRFIGFVNDYHLAYISYKFLPNLIYEKMNQSLEIQKELDRMEVKIERIHEAFAERKSKQMNQLLLVISLLSILSVVTDLSTWLTQMGIPPSVVYSPAVPLVLAGGIVIIGYWIYKASK